LGIYHLTFASMRCFARNEQNMGKRSATSEPHRSCCATLRP